MEHSGFPGGEVLGVFSIGALRAGDIEGAAKILSRARSGYAMSLLLRLALVAPGLAMRTAWRMLARRRNCDRARLEVARWSRAHGGSVVRR